MTISREVAIRDEAIDEWFEATRPVRDVPAADEFPRYPDVTVELLGRDGNAFAVLGRVQRALRDAGHDPAPFMDEATAGDYDHLLQTCFRWVDVA